MIYANLEIKQLDDSEYQVTILILCNKESVLATIATLSKHGPNILRKFYNLE